MGKGLISSALSFISTHVHTYTDQVLSLKEGLEGAQEHVRSCLLSLSKLSDPKTPLVDTPTQAHIEVTPDLVQHAGGEETTCSNDDTSDDEMVTMTIPCSIITILCILHVAPFPSLPSPPPATTLHHQIRYTKPTFRQVV